MFPSVLRQGSKGCAKDSIHLSVSRFHIPFLLLGICVNIKWNMTEITSVMPHVKYFPIRFILRQSCVQNISLMRRLHWVSIFHGSIHCRICVSRTHNSSRKRNSLLSKSLTPSFSTVVVNLDCHVDWICNSEIDLWTRLWRYSQKGFPKRGRLHPKWAASSFVVQIKRWKRKLWWLLNFASC